MLGSSRSLKAALVAGRFIASSGRVLRRTPWQEIESRLAGQRTNAAEIVQPGTLHAAPNPGMARKQQSPRTVARVLEQATMFDERQKRLNKHKAK